MIWYWITNICTVPCKWLLLSMSTTLTSEFFMKGWNHFGISVGDVLFLFFFLPPPPCPVVDVLVQETFRWLHWWESMGATSYIIRIYSHSKLSDLVFTLLPHLLHCSLRLRNRHCFIDVSTGSGFYNFVISCRFLFVCKTLVYLVSLVWPIK